ncbi:uncharacterized protein VTP21DRAFT_7673 [Calcarisporiella thermophila]|uniref:uncharacterized protein n=1 Tax=Calcarisporiella thermophila TaxID=911321 RepID=UPI0037448BB4
MTSTRTRFRALEICRQPWSHPVPRNISNFRISRYHRWLAPAPPLGYGPGPPPCFLFKPATHSPISCTKPSMPQAVNVKLIDVLWAAQVQAASPVYRREGYKHVFCKPLGLFVRGGLFAL